MKVLSLLLPLLLASFPLAAQEAAPQERAFQAERRQSAGERRGEGVVLLYKAADAAAAQRTDEGVDSAARILENVLQEQGYQVTQPDPATQAILDKGPDTIVTFAPDAGLSVLLSAKRRELPMVGDPRKRVKVEISLNARVYCGSLLQPSPPEAQASVDVLPGAQGKGYDFVGKKAANRLAENLRADLARRNKACVGALDRMIADYRGGQPEASAPAPVASGPLARPKRVWALLAGVSDFSQVRRITGQNVGDLKGVRADMDLMRATLLERGVPRGNIISLLDAQATSGAFRQQLRDMQQKAGPEDLLLVYISSHGLEADLFEGTPDKPSLSGYGLPVFHDFDMNPDPAKRASVVDFWEIQSYLLNSRAGQIVWLVDTCHAGGAAIGLGVRANAPPAARSERVQVGARGLQRIDPANAVFNPVQAAEAAAQVNSGRHLIVLSAATPQQLALEQGNGYFTLSLANGLKQNKAPVLLEQLFRDVVEKQVLQASHGKQQPVMGKSGRGGDIKL